jgi:amino acid adenylation domain-containing protein/non-ribosomal peptide synthase protein (TIGR01720 family)
VQKYSSRGDKDMENNGHSETLMAIASQFSKERDYWLNRLSGDFEKIGFPYTNKRSASSEPRDTGAWPAPGVVKFELPRLLSSRLIKICGGSDAKLHITLVAAVILLLDKYNHQHIEDIIVGIPIYKQRIEGRLVNTVLALRNHLGQIMTFKELILQVRQLLKEAAKNQNYPIEALLYQLGMPSDQEEFPLFDLAVLLENIHSREYLRHINLNMLFSFLRSGETIEALVEYNPSKYHQADVERIGRHLIHLMQNAIFDLDAKISHLEILSEEEKNHILYDLNDKNGEAGYPRDKTLHRLFEEQAERSPGRMALIGNWQLAVGKKEKMHVTYGVLNEKANQLARVLKEKSILADSLIGVMLERSIEMIVGILGILKTGGAYMPIDPDYPEERIKYMLADSAARVLLTTSTLVEQGEKLRSWNGERIFVDAVKQGRPAGSPLPSIACCPSPATGTSLAYVIYTSGTTGKPKGALIQHHNVVRLMFHDNYLFDFDNNDVWTMFHSYCFDFSVWEMYGALLYGGKLAIIPKIVSKDPQRYLEILEKDGVTILNQTPSAFYNLVNEVFNPSNRERKLEIKYIIFGGETLKPIKLKKWQEKYPDVKLINMFGITETTVHVTYKEIGAKEIENNISNIGKPIPTLTTCVLDKGLKPVPVGVAGELCVGGDGLGRGYLNRTELTAEKFIDHPYKQGYRLYKSGDLARFLENGDLEYLGRIDHQVKIRGFRIEPGEIESQLLKHEAVNEAVVLAREDQAAEKAKYLCAYVVLAGQEVFKEKSYIASEFRNYLSGKLPDYMIPSYFVNIDRIPLNSNGKVDRKALPEPEIQAGDRYAEPRNEVEEILVKIWGEVLGTQRAGINDNFFELGGDSIKAIQIAALLNKSGYKVDMRDIFANLLISELAPKVKKIERSGDQSVIKGIVPLTPIQKHFFECYLIEPHHFNQAVMFYSREGLTEEAVRTIFAKIQEHHDALRMVYRRESEEIIQLNQGLDHPCSIAVYDLRKCEKSVETLTSQCSRIQASIDMETGPLMKVGLFHMDDGDRLLIVVHHLVIDGVSWRILFEDIETLYRQYMKGEPLELPAKTDSFKIWAEKLVQYADSKLLLKEKAYWQGLELKEIQELKKEFEAEGHFIKDGDTLSFELDESETEALLKKANSAFGTEINDILLISLGMALKKIFKHDRFLIALEGHGRESILEGINVNRTVGWFTSVYPVLLETSYESNLSRQIKEIKESLRRVPNKGIGCGLLKYMTAMEHKAEMNFKLKPQISFNYLGQFDSELRKMSAFEIAKESYGNVISPESQREYEFDVSGMIVNKRLSISIGYDRKHYQAETVRALLNDYRDKLVQIIMFCSTRERKELTPSDFTYPGLSIEIVDRLQDRYSYLLKDIYPLTPMQEGMFFHYLYDKSSSAYFEQISFRYHGELNIQLVEKSLNEIIKHYDRLRTVFTNTINNRLLQVVLKNRKIDCHYEDISKRKDQCDYLKRYKERDKKNLFDLTGDMLIRMAVFRLDPSEYEFVWSFHHIVMDGWSIGILLSGYSEIYNSFLADRPYHLPEVKPYRIYIEWLEKQDKESARSYWEKYLEGYEQKTSVPEFKRSKAVKEGYKNERVELTFNKEKTSHLNTLAGKHNVTLSTIFCAVWAVILGKYNNSREVVFGIVVSGRPPDIEDVESMVGLFINTVPFRSKWEEGIEFTSLLKGIQEREVRGLPYHYYPLVEIQKLSALKHNLFDHILIFENYPFEKQIKGIKLNFSNIRGFDQTNFDFIIVVNPGDQIKIRITYNGHVYEGSLVKRIPFHIKEVINQILENPHIKISRIEIINEAERRRLIEKLKKEKGKNYTEDVEKSRHQPGELDAVLNF